MIKTISAKLLLISPLTLWVGLVGIGLAWIYIFSNYAIYSLFPVGWSFFVIQPLLWLALGGVSWFGYRSLAQKPAFNGRLAVCAILAGVLQAALFFIVSLPFPFGRSPYGHNLLTVLGNLLYISAFTAEIEVNRVFFGAAIGARHPGRALAGVTVLFALAAIPAAQFSRLGDPAAAFSFLGQTVLPGLSRSLLATYLAMIGGPLVSAGYMGVMALAEWLPPILPNPPWLVSAFFGTLFPIIVLYVLNRMLAPAAPVEAGSSRSITREPRPLGLVISWVLVGVLGLGLVGFSSGLLGPRPFLVSGGSMDPTFYAGDIVVASPVKIDFLVVGDIIRYHRNGIEVVHRIVDILKDPGGSIYITRGDNNNTNDAPVQSNQIDGKVTLAIPKLGLVVSGIHDVFSRLGVGR